MSTEQNAEKAALAIPCPRGTCRAMPDVWCGITALGPWMHGLRWNLAAACDRGPCWLGKEHNGDCRPGPGRMTTPSASAPEGNAATEPPLALQRDVHGATQHNPEQDEALGTYAAGCQKCGWQGHRYDYTDQTRDTQRALARTEIRDHKAGCDMWFEEDDRG